MATQYKLKVLEQLRAGTLDIRTDWRVSPTGFPFKVVQVEGTISEPAVADARKAVCDLGALRTPYKKATGAIDYRCPAEPLAVYTGRKGGREANAEGRRCLCNALMSAAGMPQVRRGGVAEPAIITSGDDFSVVATLMNALPADQPMYHAVAVIELMRSGLAVAA
jgi:NAD(P)H-dependent flavin oxidoreductase YrpB (nitropropane dioxygenase family)